VTILPSLFLRTAANTLILGRCRSRVLGLFKMQRPKSLTLCWHSVDALWKLICHVAASTHTILSIKAANTSIIPVNCHCTAIELYKMQHSKWLTLCWRSFSDWGCDHVVISFAHNGCQYGDYGYIKCYQRVQVLTAKTGRFGSRTVQQPDPHTLGGPNPDRYQSTRGFRRVSLYLSVPMSSSAFRISHLWLHSDMLRIIVKYWPWYVTVHFRCISRLDV
jgi:hypothetical protein